MTEEEYKRILLALSNFEERITQEIEARIPNMIDRHFNERGFIGQSPIKRRVVPKGWSVIPGGCRPKA